MTVAAEAPEQLQNEYFGVITGTRPDKYGWLSPVHAAAVK